MLRPSLVLVPARHGSTTLRRPARGQTPTVLVPSFMLKPFPLPQYVSVNSARRVLPRTASLEKLLMHHGTGRCSVISSTFVPHPWLACRVEPRQTSSRNVSTIALAQSCRCRQELLCLKGGQTRHLLHANAEQGDDSSLLLHVRSSPQVNRPNISASIRQFDFPNELAPLPRTHRGQTSLHDATNSPSFRDIESAMIIAEFASSLSLCISGVYGLLRVHLASRQSFHTLAPHALSEGLAI